MFFAVYHQKLHSSSGKDTKVLFDITKYMRLNTKLSIRTDVRYEVVISDVISTIWVQSCEIRMDFKTKKAEQSNNFEM
jgi:hypothetical protein